MTKSPQQNFFDQKAAQNYDERNSKLSAIADNLHFLIRLLLNDCPVSARILCVGVGTGAEIISLAKEFPQWTFVGVDPSSAMLEMCRARLENEGILDRCQLIQGYVQDVPGVVSFDAALSILVAHFIKKEERLSFFQEMSHRLKETGVLVNAEISFDLNSAEFPTMLDQWKKIQGLMGGTPESLAKLPDQLRNVLTVLPPAETENLIRQSGIDLPVRFFQSFMISAWYGQKSS